MLKLANIVAVTVSVAVVAGVGCSRQEVAGDSARAVTTVQEASSKTSMLPTPFTAEQIRDEWIVGFEAVAGDEVVTVLEQIERFRPESPDQG